MRKLFFYLVLIVAPNLNQAANNVATISEISNAIKKHYNNYKNNLLSGSNYVDYKFWCDYIDSDISYVTNLTTQGSAESAIPTIDFLYQKNIILNRNAQNHIREIKYTIFANIIAILKGYKNNCDYILEYYNIYPSMIYELSPEILKKELATLRRNVEAGAATNSLDSKIIDEIENNIFKRNVKVTYEKEKNICKVEGEVISLKQIKKEILKQCPGSVEAIKLFAYNTILIDEDFDINIAKYILMFAPNLKNVNFPAMTDTNTKSACLIMIRIPQSMNSNEFSPFGYDEYYSEFYISKSDSVLRYMIFGNDPSLTENDINKIVTENIDYYKKKLIKSASANHIDVDMKIELVNQINRFKYLNEDPNNILLIYEDLKNLIGLTKELSIFNAKKLYKSMLQRLSDMEDKIQDFEREGSAPDYSREKKFLIYMKSVVAGKLIAVGSKKPGFVIFNLAEYIDGTTSFLEGLKTGLSQVNVQSLHEKYIERIDIKKQECQEYANKTIMPAISKLNDDLINRVKALNETIVAKINAAEKEIEKIRWKQVWAVFSGVLNIVGKVAMVLGGPVGIIAGTVLSAAGSMTSSLSDHTSTILVPPNIEKNRIELDDFLKDYDQRDEKILEVKIKYFQDNVKNPKVLKKLNEIRNTPNTVASEKIKSIDEYLDKKIEGLGSATVKNVNDLNGYKACKKITKLSGAAVEVVEKAVETIIKVGALESAIDQKKLEITYLNNLKNTINDKLVPFLRKLKGELDKQAGNMRKLTLGGLGIKKFEISQLLGNLKKQLTQITQGFDESPEIIECVEKLITFFDALINLYEIIQNYEEHLEFVNYVTELVHGPGILDNSKFSNRKTDMELMIKKDLIIEDYIYIYNGVKQFAFPSMTPFNMYSSLREKIDQNNDLTAIVNLMTNSFANIKQTLTKIRYSSQYANYYTTIIAHQPRTLYSLRYNSETAKTFNDLFDGKPIYVSTIQEIIEGRGLNAQKFTKMNMRIQPNDAELLNLLEGVNIEITHMGDSYYKCQNKFYSIPNAEFRMISSYSGLRTETNTENFESNSTLPQFSPYATFRLKLSIDHSLEQNKSMNSNEIFPKLKSKINNSLEISLIIFHQYEDKGYEHCTETPNQFNEITLIQN